MPMTPQELLDRLRALEIVCRTVEHPPVYTVEEAKAHRADLPGTHTKNLFVRNKKKRMWLVTTHEDRPVDLKALGKRLRGGNLSFGSPERLRQYLGVEPGSVTPLAAINDEAGEVEVVLDRELAEAASVCCHPLINTMTTALSGPELIRFLQTVGHPPRLLDLDADPDQGRQ